MNRTYKYRLYPSRKQQEALDFQLWQMRTVYNDALAERRWMWERSRLGVSYPQQWARFKQARKDFPDTIGPLNATGTQQMLRRLDKAFNAFFRRIKRGETAGYPRFKGRDRFKSLEYKHGDGCKLRTDVAGRKLQYIQRVGEVKVKFHRPIPDNAVIKHVVVKQQNGKWYVTLMLELPDVKVVHPTGRQVGIDVGLHALLALSDGGLYDNPRWLKKSLADLRVASRRLGRRKKGGKRRKKAAVQVARLHEKIANQRRDYWHKTTRQLVDRYGLVAIEDLNLAFMTRNKHLSRSAHDAGLGMFRQLLEYKAEEAGTQLVAVNPRNTSQECSGYECDRVVPKTLKVRVHQCECGLIMDRDVNAARNILALGRSVQELTYPNGEGVVLRSSPL